MSERIGTTGAIVTIATSLMKMTGSTLAGTRWVTAFCCPKFASAVRDKVLRLYEDGTWLVENNEGQWPLVDIRFCPFCGKSVGRS